MDAPNINRRPSEAVSVLMKGMASIICTINNGFTLIMYYFTGVRTKRYTMAVLGFIGIANAYAMRSVLSVAITEMVVDIHKTTLDPNGCPGPATTKNTTNPVGEHGNLCIQGD